jgi:LCP family protein required for cell wall assembly
LDKPPETPQEDQENTLPSNQQPTVPSGGYDYSHLRESKGQDHWYAVPTSDVTQPSANAPRPQGAWSPNQSSAPPTWSPNPTTAPTQAHPAGPPNPAVPAPVVTRPVQQGPTRQRVQQRRKRKQAGRPDNWAWVVIASALLGVTIIGSMVLVFVVRFALRGNDGNTTVASGPRIEPTSIIYGGEGALEGNSLELTTAAWNGTERFTVLVMGLDKRPDESGSVFRTDSMMLISFDPANNSIGILSIPRDLYVEVPYAGLHRINAAYVIGELESPDGGPALAMQTVQYNFGIRVNEYVTVDFDTFISVIDAIGGIDIEVPREITDYAYPTMDYGTETFHVDAGWQTMNGTTALKYARTRHASDDIDRAHRQQQVLYAIRDKVTSLDIIDDLIVQAPFLYANLRNGIDTGLSLDQMVQLALWAADVPRENIHSDVVGWEYLSGYQTPTGGSVVVPNRARIGDLMVQVFGTSYNQ